MSHSANPLVSVIIPVYNGVNYLRESVDSVLSQTFEDYEIIVVDDGSTDNTWEIINSYGTLLRGIRKENGGVASALNCGLHEARGKWIAWLSHDDVFLPDKLLKQVTFLHENSEYKACYTNYGVIDEKNNIIKDEIVPWYSREEAIRRLFSVCYINGSSMLIDQECFQTLGLFNEALKFTQDLEMWIRILTRFSIGHLNEKLLLWRQHSAQASSMIHKHRSEEQETYEHMFEFIGPSQMLKGRALLDNQQIIRAKAHEWLAETMKTYRGWYIFAMRHYRQSLKIWPSVRNSSLPKYISLKLQLRGSPDQCERAEAFIMEGRFLARQGEINQARFAFGKSICIQPTRLDAIIYWAIMIFGESAFSRLRQYRNRKIYQAFY